MRTKNLILVFILFATGCVAQTTDVSDSFHTKDYPKNIYSINSDTFRLKNIKITVTQVTQKKIDDKKPICKAWLTVIRDDKRIYQRHFKNILPFANCHGLFVPNEQPNNDYFIVSKFGDSDGKIFIINSLGNVIENIGGDYSLTDDKRVLLSNYASMSSYGLTVFDFKTGKTLFSEKLKLPLTYWSRQDSKYVTYLREDDNPSDSLKFVLFDFESNKLKVLKMKSSDYRDNRLPVNTPYKIKNCNCGTSSER